jgi:hypothetical protein
MEPINYDLDDPDPARRRIAEDSFRSYLSLSLYMRSAFARVLRAIQPSANKWDAPKSKTLRLRANEIDAKEAERTRLAKVRELVPLFRAIAEAGREGGAPPTARFLFSEAATYLSNYHGDLPAEIEAQRIMASGVFPKGPPARQTIRDACRGFSVAQLCGEA